MSVAPSCMVACCACQGPCITTFKVFLLEFVRGGVLRVFRVPVSLPFKGVFCVCACIYMLGVCGWVGGCGGVLHGPGVPVPLLFRFLCVCVRARVYVYTCIHMYTHVYTSID